MIPHDPAWWAFGLPLHERLAGGSVDGVVDGLLDGEGHGDGLDEARRRLASWRAAYGPAGEVWSRRLADAGLDETTLLALLAESPTSLAARVRRPAWVDVAERAMRQTPADEPATTWREAFAARLRPFVEDAAQRLVEQAGESLRGQDAEGIARGFTTALSRRLVRIATRTFVHEHNEHGPTELAGLLPAYPVLARLLGQTCLQAVESTVELLDRFAEDRPAIVDTLLGGTDPGRLTTIETGLGDAHRRGRSVAVLTFADGAKAVYKPRDLTAHQRFADMVDWLNRQVPGIDLRVPDVLARPGYGWLEFVPRRPLTDSAAAARFYRRQGALLALLHAVRAADVHCENLIACGDQPVLVDAETLFQTGLRATGTGPADPAARTLAASVHRTGLLPMLVVGDNGAVEVSGLGGERGQAAERTTLDWEHHDERLRPVRRTTSFPGAANRPRLGERELDAADHEDAILDGFRHTYDAIAHGRAELAAIVETCAGTEVRVVVRHTRGYATLLTESTRPELLTDALERDRALDLLWTESARHPVRWQVCRYEQEDLWAHDIPLFTTRADTTALWSSDGRPIPGALDRPGLAAALETIRALDGSDRRDQEWIISATLATLSSTVDHTGTALLPGPVATAPPDRLLDAACALADDIVARAAANPGRVNWLGLEPVEDRRWMVLPMGAGLANGYTGVALFLAQVAELSGNTRYGALARQALDGIPGLYATLATRPDLVAAVGCGGLHGFGGIAYALARLATLLADDELAGWARTAVDLAAAAAGPATPPGIAAGSAGCLAAMNAVHADLGYAEAERLAGDRADALAGFVAHPEGTPAGFANGMAGIGWALARFGRDPRQVEAGRALVREVPPTAPTPGWCAGTAGITAARTALPDAGPVVLTDRPVLADLSLCHGELGVTDILASAGEHDAPHERAAQVAGALDRQGAACGTPGLVDTPGLLSGLAGIGYGLLRLGFPGRVPSVLLFEPNVDPTTDRRSTCRTPTLTSTRPTTPTRPTTTP